MGVLADDDITAVWSHETETLLSSWAEKASCFRWLHGRSEKRYRRRYYSFAVPTIVLSTLAGAAGFALDSYVPEGYKDGAQATIGGIKVIMIYKITCVRADWPVSVRFRFQSSKQEIGNRNLAKKPKKLSRFSHRSFDFCGFPAV